MSAADGGGNELVVVSAVLLGLGLVRPWTSTWTRLLGVHLGMESLQNDRLLRLVPLVLRRMSWSGGDCVKSLVGRVLLLVLIKLNSGAVPITTPTTLAQHNCPTFSCEAPSTAKKAPTRSSASPGMLRSSSAAVTQSVFMVRLSRTGPSHSAA